MRRFSIRTLMAAIVAVAIGLAALRTANDWWAGALFMVALFAAGTSILGAICLRGRSRAWSTGFALFSSGHLVMTCAPVISNAVGSHLATSTALDYVHTQVVGSEPLNYPAAQWHQFVAARRRSKTTQMTKSQGNEQPNPVVHTLRTLVAPNLVANESQPPVNRWRTMLPGAANAEDFTRVGHSLFALLAGLLGATIADGFHARRERQESNP